jgi:hypothetical protein
MHLDFVSGKLILSVRSNAVSHCADQRGLGPSAAHAGGLEWRVWFAIKEEAEKAAQT